MPIGNMIKLNWFRRISDDAILQVRILNINNGTLLAQSTMTDPAKVLATFRLRASEWHGYLLVDENGNYILDNGEVEV
jgi:hypothetical protein